MPRKPTRAARRSGGGHRTLGWVVLALLVAAVAGFWYYRRQQTTAARAVATAACGAALPDFHGAAVQQARSAPFRTIEQLLRQPPQGEPLVRVQARLLQYRLQGHEYRLLLGSLVSPGVSVAAYLPEGACAPNQADGALYDELREDISLQFGSMKGTGTAPAQPPTVVVTGVAMRGANGVELRPVLDFKALGN